MLNVWHYSSCIIPHSQSSTLTQARYLINLSFQTLIKCTKLTEDTTLYRVDTLIWMRQCKLILTKKTTRITLANEVHLMRDGTLTVFNYAIQGRPHMPPGNWTYVPQALSPHTSQSELRNKSSYSNEKLVHHNQSSSRSLQLEKARVQQPRPSTGRRGRKGM